MKDIYASFGGLKERMLKRIEGWNTKLLSQEGKEILINSVLQVILAYVMNYFLFPKTFSNELEQIIAKFCWSKGKG